MAIINHELLNKLYWEEKDGKDFRLRLGWRLLFFFGINYGLYGGIDLILHSSGPSQFEATPVTSEDTDSNQLQDYYYSLNPWHFLMMRSIAMTISILSTYWSFLLLDMRTKYDFYTINFGGQNLRDIFSNIKRYSILLLSGYILASIMIASYYFFNYFLDLVDVRYEGTHILTICVYFTGTIMHSISEEIICRGYWLTNLRENYNDLTSMVIVNLFFSSLHLINPNITWRSFISLFICGMMFTVPRSKNNGIWISIGLHAAWNFFIGNVFGDSVSGVKFKSSIWRVTYHGVSSRDILFGPESSLVLAVGALLTCWILFRKVPLKF